jgi:S-DNA-T family DNA segregation ATPase FtsK/SpoIIIE
MARSGDGVMGQDHDGHDGPVLVDVDGDGVPDPVTPGPRPAPRLGPPGTALAVVEDHDNIAIQDREGHDVEAYESQAEDHRRWSSALDEHTGRGQRLTEAARRRRDAAERPLIHEALMSWVAFTSFIAVFGRFYARLAMYHLLRFHLHVYGRSWRAVRGAYRLERIFTWWAFDHNAGKVEGALTALAHHKPNIEIADRWKAIRTKREVSWAIRVPPWFLLHIGAIGGSVAVWFLAPWWVQVALALGVVLALAKLGTDPGKPVVAPGANLPVAPKLTVDLVTAALLSLGIAEINKTVTPGYNRLGIRYPTIPHRDGPGYRLDVHLPQGVEALEVIDKRGKLASGLQRPTGCVWPETGGPRQHAGHLVLWVGDEPFSEQPQPRWPLAKGGAADLFEPVPYGFDQRGREVTIPLMYNNLLVGAIPRQGKSFAVRVISLVAALDPTCELHSHELKGTGDQQAVESVCHRYTSGPPAEDTLKSVMDSIREVHSYLDPRARTIGDLPQEVCPEKKVTRDLANRRDLRLWPVLLVIDECQELFESEYGAEAEILCKAIIKRGPALGIMLVLATQRPDAKALPRSIASSMGARLCLKVMDHDANDMVLGTGAHKGGMRATTLTEDDKGVGLLRDGGAAKMVRSAYIDGPAAMRIGQRARARREALGLLTGNAAGQEWDDPTARVDYVALAASVFAPGEERLHNVEILARLNRAQPGGPFDGWRESQLTDVLKSAGVDGAGRQAKVGGINKRGVYLSDLRAALAARDEPEPTPVAPRPAVAEDDDEDYFADVEGPGDDRAGG